LLLLLAGVLLLLLGSPDSTATPLGGQQ